MGLIKLSRPVDRAGTLKAIEKRKCEMSLAAFVKAAWHVIEPGQPYVHGWHIDHICLPGHVTLETRSGPRSIRSIVEEKWDGEVLSFNHDTGLPEWRRILAHMRNPGRPLFTVTSNDVSVSMTGNHPVFVDGLGYTSAALVEAGQHVVQLQAVRDRVQSVASKDRWGRILQSEMLCDSEVQAGKSRLFSVWWGKVSERWKCMLGLQTISSSQGQGSPVPSLRDAAVVNTVKASCVLQPSMHWQGQAWTQEPGICGWKGPNPVSVDLQVGQSKSAEARWRGVLRLLFSKTVGCSPHRPEYEQQRGVEPRIAVPGVPSGAGSEEERFGTVKCNVSSVKPEVWIPDEVYNVEVEGNNNYFADGLLVHNCAHLEAITDGQKNDDGTFYNRLLVNVPPGTMKSLLIGVFWPAWEWGPRNKPHLRYVCASHSLDLAIRDSLRMRRLVTDAWYQSHWGDRVQITGDQNAKAKFETTMTGFRQACAFTGITGYRGDRVLCLPHETMVLSSEGWMPIGKIVDERLPVRIAGHDGDTTTWQEIEAYERNPAAPLVSIRTASGGFECTGNHLVYVKDKGWIEAEQVCAGDGIYLSPLWQTSSGEEVLHSPVLSGSPSEGGSGAEHQAVSEVRSASVSYAVPLEADAERRVLQPPMRVIGGHQRNVDWRTGYLDLSTVPDDVQSQEVGSEAGEMVFADMCQLVDMGSERSSPSREALRGMREGLQAEQSPDHHVFAGLCGKASVEVPAWGGEWPIRAWGSSEAVSGGMDTELQGVDQGAGWECLPALRIDGADAARPSHRLHQGELGPVEPDHGMQTLSRFDARFVAEPTGMVCQTVISVEKSSRVIDATYNLRVGPNHNYFANGFLLHNCDDPHSVDDANSDAKRETVTTLFKEAVTSRLNNPDESAIVVVMQRLHEGDVSGVILDNDMGYDHVMLPMRFDPHRACVTRLGYADPRELDGELLFPDRFPEHVVDRDEAAMGPYATAGQYAQSPEPRGGGIVKDAWWKLWDKPEYPGIEYIVASLDTAYTTKSENDPSALTIWGVFSASGGQASTRMVDRYGRTIESATSHQSEALGATAKVMLMYAWQGKLEIGELVVKVEEICSRMRVDLLLIENKAAGHSVAQELRRVFNSASFAVQMYDPKTLDKVARLYSIQHLFSEGMIYAPNKDWAEMVIRQTSSFPRGAHDDLVDTVSMGLKHLRDVGILTRAPERMAEIEDSKVFHGNAQDAPLYNA